MNQLGGGRGCRLAQEAEAAALAKEQEANGMLPLLEEHERTLGPLQNEAMAHQRCTANSAPVKNAHAFRQTLGRLQNEAMTHQRCATAPVPLCTCPELPLHTDKQNCGHIAHACKLAKLGWIQQWEKQAKAVVQSCHACQGCADVVCCGASPDLHQCAWSTGPGQRRRSAAQPW